MDVIEVFPPAINTDLGGVGLHTFGAPVDDFANSVFEGFKNGDGKSAMAELRSVWLHPKLNWKKQPNRCGKAS